MFRVPKCIYLTSLHYLSHRAFITSSQGWLITCKSLNMCHGKERLAYTLIQFRNVIKISECFFFFFLREVSLYFLISQIKLAVQVLLNHGCPSALPEQQLGSQTLILTTPALNCLSCGQIFPAGYPVRKEGISSSLAPLQRRGTRGFQASKAAWSQGVLGECVRGTSHLLSVISVNRQSPQDIFKNI